MERLRSNIQISNQTKKIICNKDIFDVFGNKEGKILYDTKNENSIISLYLNNPNEGDDELLMADIEYSLQKDDQGQEYIKIVHITSMNWLGAELEQKNGIPWGEKEAEYIYTREQLDKEYIHGLGTKILNILIQKLKKEYGIIQIVATPPRESYMFYIKYLQSKKNKDCSIQEEGLKKKIVWSTSFKD